MRTNTYWFQLFCAVLSGCPAVCLFSEEADVVELDEITVVGRETSLIPDAAVAEEEIVQPQHARTVDSLLTGRTGIDITRTSPGGSAGSGTVTLRGFDESRFLILLDGRPLNGSGVYGGDYVDWASLTSRNIERIEVVRGAGSAEYGNTLGGVINIITKQYSEELSAETRLSYGTFSTSDISAECRGSAGDLFLYIVSAGYWETEGFLRNNRVERSDIKARMRFSLPGGWKFGAGVCRTGHERGFIVENMKGTAFYDNDFPESDEDGGGGPGLLWWGNPGPFGPSVPSLDWGDGSYWVNIRNQYDISLSGAFEPLDLNVTLRAYLNDQDRTEYYYAVDDPDNLVLERTAEPEDNTWGWSCKIEQDIQSHTVKYGAEAHFLRYGDVEIESADLSYFRIPPSSYSGVGENTRVHSVFAQDRWDFRHDMDFDFGLRYDNYRADEEDRVVMHGLSPNTGIEWNGWENGTLDFSLAYAYRFPTCPESYWYYAGYQPADREDLSPEKALQAEIGASHRFRHGARAGVRVFSYQVEDYIRTIFGYKPSRVVYNIDEVAFFGIEVEGEYTFNKHMSVFANYTFQETEKKRDILDESSADELVELPEHKAYAGFRFSAENGLTSDAGIRYVGERGTVTGSLAVPGASAVEEMGGFVTVDAHLSYPVRNRDGYGGVLRIGAENIFSRDYQEVYGFPMPGRTITLGIDMMF